MYEYMKKILLILSFCIAICFSVNNTLAVESTLFASNTVLAQAYLTLNATDMRAQTFTATVDNITAFHAYLNDRVNGSTIVAYLINESSQEVIETSSQRMGSGNGWEEFNFNSPLSKESVYRVKILVPVASGVKWVRSGDVYSGGWYYFGAGPGDYDTSSDMVFQAWGYNNPTPVDPGVSGQTSTPISSSTAASSDSTGESAGNSTVASEAPDTNVTASIAKPTELKATYNKTVNLDWKASTTLDIDGYKIFRSETKGKGYSKIGQVTKASTTYSDRTVLLGKTYYYIVRAYKGSGQSGSSNEASITIPTNQLSSAVVSTDQKNVAPKNNYLLWIIIIAVIVLGLILLIVIKRRKNKTKRDITTDRGLKP